MKPRDKQNFLLKRARPARFSRKKQTEYKADFEVLKSAREEMKEHRRSMHRDMEESKEKETKMNVDIRNTNSNAGIQKDSYRRETQNQRRRANCSD